jgi:hypothetical protein
MKNQILLPLFITVIIFGCNGGSKYSEEAVNAIKNATDLKVEKVELPCATVEYKLDGNNIKMIVANYITSFGSSECNLEFYYSDDKLIYFKEVDSSHAMSEGESESSIDYNYYFENETVTKCISENKEVKLSEIQYTTLPNEILPLSNKLIKSYSSKDTTVLCDKILQ